MKSPALESLLGFSMARTFGLMIESVLAAPANDLEVYSAYLALSLIFWLTIRARSRNRSALWPSQ